MRCTRCNRRSRVYQEPIVQTPSPHAHPRLPAYVSMRQRASAYIIRQNTSAYVSIRQHRSRMPVLACPFTHGQGVKEWASPWPRRTRRRQGSIHPHTSTYVSTREHTRAYVHMRIVTCPVTHGQGGSADVREHKAHARESVHNQPLAKDARERNRVFERRVRLVAARCVHVDSEAAAAPLDHLLTDAWHALAGYVCIACVGISRPQPA